MGQSYIRSPEQLGSTPSMQWVACNVAGVRRLGLRKRDVSGHDLLIENEFERVCNYFGLEASTCIPGATDDCFISLISYSKRLTKKNVSDFVDRPTFDELFPLLKTKELQDKLCSIAFIDCICGNADRHADNLAILVDTLDRIVDICPPFDNVASFLNSYSTECYLAADCRRVWRHIDMFQWLSANWDGFESACSLYCSSNFVGIFHDADVASWASKQRQKLLSVIGRDVTVAQETGKNNSVYEQLTYLQSQHPTPRISLAVSYIAACPTIDKSQASLLLDILSADLKDVPELSEIIDQLSRLTE